MACPVVVQCDNVTASVTQRALRARARPQRDLLIDFEQWHQQHTRGLCRPRKRQNCWKSHSHSRSATREPRRRSRLASRNISTTIHSSGTILRSRACLADGNAACSLTSLLRTSSLSSLMAFLILLTQSWDHQSFRSVVHFRISSRCRSKETAQPRQDRHLCQYSRKSAFCCAGCRARRHAACSRGSRGIHDA